MKRVLILGMLLCTVYTVSAQNLDFGPRVALISSNVNLKDNINNVSEGDAEFGFQAGVFLRAKLLGLYIQPELLFTSSKSVLTNQGLNQDLEFNRIDIPVMLGYKLGPVRLQAGPSFTILSKAESIFQGQTDDIKDYFEDLTFGYQAGVGIDLLKFVIDLKYEGNLSAFAKSLEFTNASTDLRQNQLVFALGFKLF